MFPHRVDRLAEFRDEFRIRRVVVQLHVVAALYDAGVADIDVLVQDQRVLGIAVPRLAVIRDDDDVHVVRERQRINAVEEPADEAIDFADHGDSLRSVRTVRMRSVIDVFEVQRQHVRPFFIRQVQPLDDLVDARLARHISIEQVRIGRADAPDVGFRADEEIRGRHHAALLRTDPDRLSGIPAPILDRFAIAQHVPAVALPVREAVADDTVLRRVQPGGDRVVIREGQRREHRPHRLGNDAGVCQPVERGSVRPGARVPAETVDRDQHQVGLFHLFGPVDTTGTLGRGQQRQADKDKGQNPK